MYKFIKQVQRIELLNELNVVVVRHLFFVEARMLNVLRVCLSLQLTLAST